MYMGMRESQCVYLCVCGQASVFLYVYGYVCSYVYGNGRVHWRARNGECMSTSEHAFQFIRIRLRMCVRFVCSGVVHAMFCVLCADELVSASVCVPQNRRQIRVCSLLQQLLTAVRQFLVSHQQPPTHRRTERT